MSEIKVSVVVPSYNHARFLARRLDSVFAQTYRKFEVLFLDDASPDDTLAVFEAYRHRPNVRAVINETNTGNTFVQWNRGVRLARGEYVWLAESDDACDPAFLERLVPLLDKHPRVGLAYANSAIIDADDRVVGDLDHWLGPLGAERWHRDHLADGPTECRDVLSDRNTIPNASAVLFRRDLYLRVGGADETMTLCGDWATWVRLLAAADVAYVADPLNHFRISHSGSVRSKTEKEVLRLLERFAVLKLIDDKVGLPDAARGRAAAAAAAEWVTLARSATPAETAAAAGRVVAAAGALGADFTLAVVAGILAGAVHTGKAVEDLQTGHGDRLARLEAHAGRAAAVEAAVHDLVQSLTAERAELRAEVAAIRDQYDGLQRSVRFWDKVRNLVLPPGGTAHQATHTLRRLRRRAA